jgi:large subunit ribosomal protein L25
VKLQGGIVDFVSRQIEIETLPTDIPEHIEVDITELMLGQSIRVRELAENPKWKMVTDGDTMIVHVVALRVEEEPAAATAEAAPAAGAAAEPEVIKKGKTEKEEEDEKDKRKEKK